MKKRILIALAALVLTACDAEETFETVSDEPVQAVVAECREVFLSLPPEAATPVLESETGCVYICGDYEIYRQTLDAGDLSATVKAVSGYTLTDVTILETTQGDCKRYDLVWACAGETGDRVGKACILDDGAYHYVLSVVGDAETAREHKQVWQAMLGSFSLI